MHLCNVIHGGTNQDHIPTLIGMLDILGAKEKAENFAYYILSGKKSLVNAISKQCGKKVKKTISWKFYTVIECNVLGKRKGK